MIARAPRPAHLAELPALGQGGEMGLDPAGGDGGHVGDALAGESREAAHGVEDGTGDVGGLGRLAGEPFPRARAGAGARLRARTAPPRDPVYLPGVEGWLWAPETLCARGRLAVIAKHHFDHVRLPVVPHALQKAALAMGAPIGQSLGYEAVYVPAGGEAAPAAA